MAVATGSKRGRPATASRGDVLALVADQYLAGERVDLTIVASQLGLGRATIYRWFGSRDAVLGEVIALEFEKLVQRKRSQVRRRGAAGLLDVFDGINRAMARSTAVRKFLDQERAAAMRLLTASNGPVQPRSVACMRELIEAEVSAGKYNPPADPEALAYAIVRLAEAFLFNDAVYGMRGDTERLREVQAALLGVPAPRARKARTPPRRRRASA